MLPTLAADGELLLLSHYYHHGRGIKVGDVVSFKHPLDGEKRAAKRVVGMEGDFVLRDTPGKGKGIMMQVHSQEHAPHMRYDTSDEDRTDEEIGTEGTLLRGRG